MYLRVRLVGLGWVDFFHFSMGWIELGLGLFRLGQRKWKWKHNHVRNDPTGVHDNYAASNTVQNTKRNKTAQDVWVYP